ncbi:putative fimbrial chaperone YadV [Paraburkholderia caffeinitolerans]|uniref:Putative fimbrial chaperone YadV n=2 Tax=Burkholderiaceae TaxID=119060 RepID=A0A6J5GYF6_9BURK|nr:putative fimbrial chaperone YadV [Paraburkholderia caffeinitolerans]
MGAAPPCRVRAHESGPRGRHARARAWWPLRVARLAHFAQCTLALTALLAAALSLPAHAGVTPETSRVIFPAGETEQSLQVFNANPYPVLAQAWIDDGRIDGVPQESSAPFVVLPPIFRMAKGDQRSLRIIHAGGQLPSDRESLFWLNLYEIPSLPKQQQPANAQAVTVTMRTQIKVFVRPAGLPYGSRELPKRLTFSLARAAGKLTLRIRNPTPYYASFSAVLVKAGGHSQQITPDMVAPLSTSTLALEQLDAQAGERAEVLFSLIDDDGIQAVDSVKAEIAP